LTFTVGGKESEDDGRSK